MLRAAEVMNVRRPECEVLEGRTLPSLTGAQLFANSLGSHAHAVIASTPSGRSVVAWVQERTPLDTPHVYLTNRSSFYDIPAANTFLFLLTRLAR